MVITQSVPPRDDTAVTPPSSAWRFVIAVGLLVALFAAASVWVGVSLIG